MVDKTWPLVSVIIPVYNRREIVSQTIESVLSQDWPRFEVVIVDDGSTDGTAEYLEQTYGGRVRLVRQANAGPSAARNTALRASTGDFLTCIDSDDEMPPGSIRSRAEALMAAPWADVSYGWAVFQQKHGVWPDAAAPPRTDEQAWPKGDILAHYVRTSSSLSHTVTMFRRKLLPPDGALYDPQAHVRGDYIVMLRLLSSAQAVPCYCTVVRVSRKAGEHRQRNAHQSFLEQGLGPVERVLANPQIAKRLEPLLPQVRAFFWIATSRAARHMRLAPAYRHAIRQAHAADPRSVCFSDWRHFLLSYVYPRW